MQGACSRGSKCVCSACNTCRPSVWARAIVASQTLGLHVLHALHTHLLPWLQAPCTIVALASYINQRPE